MFILEKLPYTFESLEPYISKETIEYHYGKHHKGYVDKLNMLIKGTEFENKTLDFIIKNSNGSIFNNAAQVWNHNFYWKCLTSNTNKLIDGSLKENIDKTFGNFANFQKLFGESAQNNFGSGWTWLVKSNDNTLKIINTSNANTIITTDDIPLLVIDVWEHAYYIDKRNERTKYIEDFWNIIDWEFVSKNFK